MFYKVTACKEISINGEWHTQTTDLLIEAESETDAEWEVRKLGYSPLITKWETLPTT